MAIINPNLTHLVKSLKEGKRGAALEGSSRSGKTWSGVDFIVWLCSKVETKAVINIYRQTYNSFKTTLYNDLNDRLPMYGIDSPCQNVQDVAQFKLFGNRINLIGADNVAPKMGGGCDYAFFNEAIHIPKKVFDQVQIRCRKFFWLDYNPEGTKHYIYDNVLKRQDIAFLRTTFEDNPFVPQFQKATILGYEPTHPQDRHLPYDDRRPHPLNVIQGTADRYLWEVFGLGLRANRKGSIMPDWGRYRDLPKDAKFIGYGIDFGFETSQAAICAMWQHGRAFYVRQVLYQTQLTDPMLIERMKELGLDPNEDYVADSADPSAIKTLRMAGFRVFAVEKKAGKEKTWMQHGIKTMKSFPVYIHESSTDFHEEQSLWKWKEDINGESLNVEDDKHNHLMKAAMYLLCWHVDRKRLSVS